MPGDLRADLSNHGLQQPAGGRQSCAKAPGLAQGLAKVKQSGEGRHGASQRGPDPLTDAWPCEATRSLAAQVSAAHLSPACPCCPHTSLVQVVVLSQAVTRPRGVPPQGGQHVHWLLLQMQPAQSTPGWLSRGALAAPQRFAHKVPRHTAAAPASNICCEKCRAARNSERQTAHPALAAHRRFVTKGIRHYTRRYRAGRAGSESKPARSMDPHCKQGRPERGTPQS